MGEVTVIINPFNWFLGWNGEKQDKNSLSFANNHFIVLYFLPWKINIFLWNKKEIICKLVFLWTLFFSWQKYIIHPLKNMKSKKKIIFLKSFLETLALKISVDIFLKLNFFSFSCVKLYREQEHMLLLMIHKEIKAVHPKKHFFVGHTV